MNWKPVKFRFFLTKITHDNSDGYACCCLVYCVDIKVYHTCNVHQFNELNVYLLCELYIHTSYMYVDLIGKCTWNDMHKGFL